MPLGNCCVPKALSVSNTTFLHERVHYITHQLKGCRQNGLVLGKVKCQVYKQERPDFLESEGEMISKFSGTTEWCGMAGAKRDKPIYTYHRQECLQDLHLDLRAGIQQPLSEREKRAGQIQVSPWPHSDVKNTTPQRSRISSGSGATPPGMVGPVLCPATSHTESV